MSTVITSVVADAPAPADNFEIGLRVFGQEIIAMTIKSQSKARNWVVLSILSLVLLIAMASEFGPSLKALIQ